MANKFKNSHSRLGYARPFDSSYARSILTGNCGAAAFSPLFGDKNLFKTDELPGKYGNIWIKLTGSLNNHNGDSITGDYEKAEEVAKDYGLFDKMPDEYSWHHVFMGWFDYAVFLEKDINYLQCKSTETIAGLLNAYQLNIAQGAYRNNDLNVYDARSWTNCFEKNFDCTTNWLPDENHYSLLQLVPKELHAENENTFSNSEGYHYDSRNQYQTYFQVTDVYKTYFYD